MKYKVGDKVKIADGCGDVCGNVSDLGENVEFLRIDMVNGDSYCYTAFSKNGKTIGDCLGCLDDRHLEYYISENKQKTFMQNIIGKFKLLKMGEPQRSFVKAGIANSDGNFTEDGKQLFNEFLISKFQSEFKTEVVDQILASEEKVNS